MVDIIDGEMAVRRLENATDAFEKTISTNQDLVNVPNVGNVPSMKKRIDDAIGADTFTQVFRNVKDWAQGEVVTSPYQRYWFPNQSEDKKHYMWFAPLASTANPITLGISPINDDNWASWDVTKQDITEAQNDIVDGSIFKGSNGETVEVGDVVEPGTTHLRVSANGNSTIVSMSPVSSGKVSGLTETSATIGGVEVLFEPCINPNTASSGAIGSLTPLAKSIKEILSFSLDTKFYLKYDGSDEGPAINSLIASVAASGVKRKIIFHSGGLSSSVPILIKSGNYDIEFDKNCKITFSPNIDGFIIGDEGSSPYEGTITNPWVVKEVFEASDHAYKLVNFTGEIHNPRQEGFAFAYAAKPSNSSRVAYGVIYNPRSRNHKRMFFYQPQDGTSYVNSNTVIGGRAENFSPNRLEYNALLDNQSGSGCQHNLIDATIFEGYSGDAATCGKASIKCVNGADFNEFKHNRNEAYKNGWEESYGVIFDNTTEGNNYEDTYLGASVADYGENNYNYPKGMKKSFPSAGVETGGFTIDRRGPVNKPLLDLTDKYSSSGNVDFLRYSTPRSQNRTGSLIDLETGYGKVLKVDDAGTLIPRDNFADIGADASTRYRDLFIVNAPTVGSDYRLKDNIKSIPQSLLDFAMTVEIQQYRLKSGESGRTHYGIVITEDFIRNLSSVTDIDSCAAFCNSVFKDADGNPVTKQIGDISVGDLWMVRYTEWQNILLEAMRRKINSL